VYLQGLTYTDAPHEQPDAWAALQSDDTATKLPGGESLDELRERLTAAVLDVARTHPGGLDGHAVIWYSWWSFMLSRACCRQHSNS
jgi:broad specificity phosphatase PhoE